MNKYQPDETGYEFVKFIQELESEDQIKAFHDKVDFCADMIYQGYSS